MKNHNWIFGLIANIALLIAIIAPINANAQNAPTPQQAKEYCDKGNMAACATLAQMLTTGAGIPKDLTSGYALFKKSCDNGYKDACIEQAIGLNTGRGIAVDKAAAIVLGDQTCNGGNVVACMFTGIQYAKGDGVPANPTKALTYFEKSCGGGFAQACAAREQLKNNMKTAASQTNTAQTNTSPPAPKLDAVADSIQKRRIPRVDTPLVPQKGEAPPETIPMMEQADTLYKSGKEGEARKIWWDACKQRNAAGCDISRTRFVSKDESTKGTYRQLSERSCNLGSARGCYVASLDMNNSNQGPANTAAARGYLGQACSFGDIFSCERLTQVYYKGELGQEIDYKSTALKGEETCATGGGLGCYYIAKMFENGEFLKTDIEAAKNYYERGCELKNPESCISFGVFLENGRGVKKDLLLALSNYEKGCNLSGNYEISCANAARMYFKGIGTAIDIQKVNIYAQKSCNALRDDECLENLSSILATNPSKTDPEVGLKQVEAYCAKGTLRETCGSLGWALFDVKNIADHKNRGYALLKSACAAGHSISCTVAGNLKDDLNKP